MYRVLIVDDEKMIRMGMKNAIDWKKLGVDDVFTAASGNEALKILKEEGPEIMDICNHNFRTFFFKNLQSLVS